MNDNLISRSLVVSGIPLKNKAKENSCRQETKVLWQQMVLSGCKGLAIAQVAKKQILGALSRQRDSGLWMVRATNGSEFMKLEPELWGQAARAQSPALSLTRHMTCVKSLNISASSFFLL